MIFIVNPDLREKIKRHLSQCFRAGALHLLFSYREGALASGCHETCLAMPTTSLLPFFQQLKCSCGALLPSQHPTALPHAEALKGLLVILLCN